MAKIWCYLFHWLPDRYGVMIRYAGGAIYLKCKKCGSEYKED
jgi:hypothetical protein